MSAAPDPLDMANNAARAVDMLAEWQERNPVEAFVRGAGQSGMTSAQLAAAMALVSVARDVRRLVDYLERLEREGE